MEIIVSCTGTDVTGHPGGIFVIQADGLPDEERLGLYEIACLILNRNGELFMLHSPGYNNVRTEPAHVDPRQRVNQGQALLLVVFLATMDQFTD